MAEDNLNLTEDKEVSPRDNIKKQNPRGMMAPTSSSLLGEALKAGFALSGKPGRATAYLQMKAEEEQKAELDYTNWYNETDKERKAAASNVSARKKLREARRDIGRTILADKGLQNAITKFNALAEEDQQINIEDPNFQLQLGEELSRQTNKDPSDYAKLVRSNIINQVINSKGAGSELDPVALYNPYKPAVEKLKESTTDKQMGEMLKRPEAKTSDRLLRGLDPKARAEAQKQDVVAGITPEIQKEMERVRRGEVTQDPYEQVTPTDPSATDTVTRNLEKNVAVLIGNSQKLITQRDALGNVTGYKKERGVTTEKNAIETAGQMRMLVANVLASREYEEGDEQKVFKDVQTLIEWAKESTKTDPNRQTGLANGVEFIKNEMSKLDKEEIPGYIADRRKDLEQDTVRNIVTKEQIKDVKPRVKELTGMTFEELTKLDTYSTYRGDPLTRIVVVEKDGKETTYTLKFRRTGKKGEAGVELEDISIGSPRQKQGEMKSTDILKRSRERRGLFSADDRLKKQIEANR